MIVEFIGESGCGKSTLVNAIISTENIKINKRSEISNGKTIHYFFKNIFKKEYRVLFVKLYAMLLGAFKHRRLMKNALYVMKLLELHFLDCESERIVLFDQGLLQLFITAFFYEKPKNDDYKEIVTSVINRFHLVVVYCECPLNVLAERINCREDNPEERSRRIAKSINQENYRHHLAMFENIISQIPDKKILRIDTSNDIDLNRKEVIEWIGGLR